MSAYKTDFAALGLHGVNAFDMVPRQVIALTLEQEKAEANRIDTLKRYHCKVAMKKAAERVNKANFCISPTPQADRDRTLALVGRSNTARTQ